MKPDCQHCAHVFREPLQGKPKEFAYTCRRNPPHAFLAMIAVQPTPSNPQGQRQVPASMWPPVFPGQACGEWKRPADLVVT